MHQAKEVLLKLKYCNSHHITNFKYIFSLTYMYNPHFCLLCLPVFTFHFHLHLTSKFWSWSLQDLGVHWKLLFYTEGGEREIWQTNHLCPTMIIKITQGQKVEKFVTSHFPAANMPICKIFWLLGTCINLNLKGCANSGIKHKLFLH